MRLTKRTTENDVFFPVSIAPVFFQHSERGFVQVPNRVGVIDDEQQEILAVVSDNYDLVLNEDVVLNAERALAQLGVSWGRNFYLNKTRTQFYAEYLAKDVSVNLGTATKPDNIHLKIIVHNSYDGTVSFSFKIGGVRQNGKTSLPIGSELFKLRKRHVGSIDVDALARQVEFAAEIFKSKVVSYWLDLSETTASLVDCEFYFQHQVTTGNLTQKFVDSVLQQLAKEMHDPDSDTVTLWNVFTAMSWVNTHEVAKSSYQRSVQLEPKITAILRELVIKGAKVE